MEKNTNIEQEDVGQLVVLRMLWGMILLFSIAMTAGSYYMVINGISILPPNPTRVVTPEGMRNFSLMFLAVAIVVFLVLPYLLIKKERTNSLHSAIALPFIIRIIMSMPVLQLGMMSMLDTKNLLDGVPFALFSIMVFIMTIPTERTVRRMANHSTRTIKVISDS